MSQTEERKYPTLKPWQLREMYGIGEKGWHAWLKPFKEKIGPLRGKQFTPAQVKIIYECLGEP